MELLEGSLNLRAANTYDGATIVGDGVLSVTGSLNDNSSVYVSEGATYEVGADDAVGSIAGDGLISLGGNQLSVGGLDVDTTFGGVISGFGGLTKVGRGTLTLSGENTYSGPTEISAGRLFVPGGLSDETDLYVSFVTTTFLRVVPSVK